jgi:hypothetical protein
MSPLVTLGRLTDPAWLCSNSPRVRSQAHTVKSHVSRANPWPLWEKHRTVLPGRSDGC